MQHINKGGVAGGLMGSSLSTETIACDIGSRVALSEPVHTSEHEFGNYKMEYETSTEQWMLKSGSAGVTGVVSKDAGSCGTWLLTCTKDTAINWHHITTDKWGNVMSSEQVLDDSKTSHISTMWEPGTESGEGDIWRRMGSVYKDERFSDLEPSNTRQWIYTATNEHNALILPVARHVGWDKPSSIDICSAQDVSDRKDNSAWSRTAMPDKGATVPIQAIGELGGTYVYDVHDGGSNIVGIGIASGIEIYDNSTIGNLNSCKMRP